ncbi:MAG: carbohydrate-binding family 9-like protein [Marinifilaceae bacterium]|nr:carbohydrate-binding family 9-like protein [Marinifilaceae bacterium]
MKQLEIIPLPEHALGDNWENTGRVLDELCPPVLLDTGAWQQDSFHLPEVTVRIGYTRQNLMLRFDVREREFRAVETGLHAPVWEDSCVELFIAPTENGGYYNFEFNSVGAFLLSHGFGRHEREKAPEEIAREMRRESIIRFSSDPRDAYPYHWQLLAEVPYTTFFKHSFVPRPGTSIRGNFYKCGNKLPHRHYLMWNPIYTPSPDFHQPDYFGEMIFK